MNGAKTAPTNNPSNKPPRAHPVLVITGPTGVGKSLFAVELARRVDGEIVGADAFQLYRGMAVLTAQPQQAARSGVTHHLIGVADPAHGFDAMEYARAADAVVAEIRSRGHRPILVGGTGFYIRAFTHGMDDLPPVDRGLRQRLEATPDSECLTQLLETDPAAGECVDVRNPRRVRRALELCLQTGRPIAGLRSRTKPQPRVEHRGVVLSRDRAQLHARIAANVEAMFANGVVEEVRRLGNPGPAAAQAIGFAEITALLKNQLPLDECKSRIIARTRRYAKRQLTWFRHQTNFEALNISNHSDWRNALELLEREAAARK